MTLREQIKELRDDFNTFRDSMTKQIIVLNRFMNRTQGFAEGYEKAQTEAEIKKQIKSGDIVVPKQILSLLAKLVGIIATIASIILIMLNA